VFDALAGCIPLIIDAGPTEHGIESTIVIVRDGKIGILRRGTITAEELSAFANVDTVASPEKIFSPGQLPSHYAPKTALRLIENARTYSPPKDQRVGFLAWSGRVRSHAKFAAIRNLSARQDLREAAANLFRHLR